MQQGFDVLAGGNAALDRGAPDLWTDGDRNLRCEAYLPVFSGLTTKRGVNTMML